jgi:hypothetical protein
MLNTPSVRSAAVAAVAMTLLIGGIAANLQAAPSALAACRVDQCTDPPPKPTATPRPMPSPTPVPPPTRFNLVLQELDCYGITDVFGDDEVYYRIGGMNGAGQSIGGTNSSGQAVDRRGPTPLQGADADNGTAWDMSTDGANKFKVLYTSLENEPLAPGQTESMYLVLQESDGTDYGPYAKYGAQGVGALIDLFTGTTTASGIASIVGNAIGDHLINSDDNLGDFTLQVQNTGPQLVIKSLAAGPYTTIKYQGPNWFSLHFEHDGGVYDAVFQIRGS